jgi:hypothetical protein
MVADWSFEGLELSRSRRVGKIVKKLFSLLVMETLHGCERTFSKRLGKEFPTSENDIWSSLNWRGSVVLGTCFEIKSDPDMLLCKSRDLKTKGGFRSWPRLKKF